MTNADLARIINSDEIQSALRPKQRQRRHERKKNPLKNLGALVKLNPYALSQRRRIILASEKTHEKRRAKLEKKRVDKKYFDEYMFGPMAFVEEGPSHVIFEEEEYYVAGGVSEESEEIEPEPEKTDEDAKKEDEEDE